MDYKMVQVMVTTRDFVKYCNLINDSWKNQEHRNMHEANEAFFLSQFDFAYLHINGEKFNSQKMKTNRKVVSPPF